MTSLPQEDDEDAVELFDASVDILVGMVGIVLVVAMLFMPFVDFAGKKQKVLGDVKSDIELSGKLTFNGLSVEPMIAGDKGLTLVSDENRFIKLDDILDSEDFIQTVQDMRDSGLQPVVFIDHDGQESAFLLETVLVKQGMKEFTRIYLDKSCDFFQTASRPVSCGRQRSRTVEPEAGSDG